jgi:hypothetical protein
MIAQFETLENRRLYSTSTAGTPITEVVNNPFTASLGKFN